MADVQMLAVWGSAGAGKTMLSAKLARELSAQKKNVMLVLCDDESPALPLLLRFPTAGEKSLGELLALETISQAEILRHCSIYNKDDRICVFGYLAGENESTYSEYLVPRVREFFSALRRLSDYVIVDCSHHLISNTLTAVALETADRVLRVSNADIRSILYFQSQKSYLQDERFHYANHLNIINAVHQNQDIAPFEQELGGHAITIPYSSALKEQYDSRCLTESLFGKEAKRFSIAMTSIIKEVLKADE